MRVYTVGHGARSLDELVATLTAPGVEEVVDVRRFPGSRRHPHFGGEPLAAALADVGIAYRWLPALGGRRKPVAGSPHLAWQVEAFRAYADHMGSEEFARGFAALTAEARRRPVAVMCAETLWTQCHRRLIADALTVAGFEVVHLLSPTRAEPHHLPTFARVTDGRLVYDVGAQPSLF